MSVQPVVHFPVFCDGLVVEFGQRNLCKGKFDFKSNPRADIQHFEKPPTHMQLTLILYSTLQVSLNSKRYLRLINAWLEQCMYKTRIFKFFHRQQPLPFLDRINFWLDRDTLSSICVLRIISSYERPRDDFQLPSFFTSAEAVHIMLLCYFGNAIRCALSA